MSEGINEAWQWRRSDVNGAEEIGKVDQRSYDGAEEIEEASDDGHSNSDLATRIRGGTKESGATDLGVATARIRGDAKAST